MAKNIDELNASFMSKRKANHVPLSPLSFLKRTFNLYPDEVSIIYGDKKFNWRETYERCVKLASSLKQHGLQKGGRGPDSSRVVIRIESLAKE